MSKSQRAHVDSAQKHNAIDGISPDKKRKEMDQKKHPNSRRARKDS